MPPADKKKFENTKEFIGRTNHLSKVYLKGKKFEYYDLPPSLEPGLPNFVLCLTCETSQEYLLGVSTSVPEHFRPYWAVHDYIENVEPGNHDSGRCLKALEKELSLVPENWKKDYLPLRKKYFEDLISFAVKDRFPKDQIAAFQKSLEHLERLVLQYQ